MSRRAAGFLLITYAALVGALYMALRYAPPERVMGNVHRIFYFHVATAWVGFLAFALVFVASLAYLRRPQARWDRLAAAAAELGVLFTTITLVMGSLWARAVWGVWWTWDPKLTTTLILWFLYVGYLLIRAAVDEPASRGRYAAVLGIAGFLNVPIVYMSSVWWTSIHPVLRQGGDMRLDPAMRLALQSAVLAFTLLFFLLLSQRVRIGRLAEEIHRRARAQTEEG
ncbi:cytochrome c biogenesis protein [Thermaerobacter composti]|uniref:Heme exporter protein C n=1 Tax=Thermaerobacter composti TaxID=554949 RepID=A0ABZ0QKL8_9FIRM|nr:cytochrome c biogenesis protein CcsA [Thermaerobacter composti]WPD18041.1 cytochrome c biogenesis protein CcsA [Thermaerobacter composti]